MNDKPYRIHVVVDPNYGESIRNLPIDEPVWIVESQDNKLVIQNLLDEHRATKGHVDITSFKFDADATPEDWLVSELSAIDLHYGEFSHDPPYSVLNIIGIKWSDRIQKGLNKLGFNLHKLTQEGFVAMKNID